jgi:hypothetical protein
MSSSVSGKFQDHYILLGVDPLSDSETIQAAYAKLAEKYNPTNKETGDPAKFEAANIAYEVLSDPELRLSFDKIKGVDHEAGCPKFSGAGFFTGLAQSAGLRAAVLCILYDRRRIKSYKPSLSIRHLESMLFAEPEVLNFALWYLKKRALIVNDDKSAMEITVDGMDFLEQSAPTAEMVMRFIKPDALSAGQPVITQPAVGNQPASAGQTAASQTSPDRRVAERRAGEPVMTALNRALQRR